MSSWAEIETNMQVFGHASQLSRVKLSDHTLRTGLLARISRNARSCLPGAVVICTIRELRTVTTHSKQLPSFESSRNREPLLGSRHISRPLFVAFLTVDLAALT
ncbi:hypothetical protein CMUS01_09941 [Colletotrichum musicola]|uniref:Uncharacterized protein n=1 Tax=Colletotrichum musicola TaxID=2175873 RepID=A0A8H6NA07_9PEZI|nr:hypothetical protein CMUS01_09941 [Colletotrichum musicola]